MNKNKDQYKNASLPHVRSPGYLVHPVTGAVMQGPHGGGRYEISFYADRSQCTTELLEPAGDEHAFKSTGKIKVEAIKEHVVAINVSINELVVLRNLFDKIIKEAEK